MLSKISNLQKRALFESPSLRQVLFFLAFTDEFLDSRFIRVHFVADLTSCTALPAVLIKTFSFQHLSRFFYCFEARCRISVCGGVHTPKCASKLWSWYYSRHLHSFPSSVRRTHRLAFPIPVPTPNPSLRCCTFPQTFQSVARTLNTKKRF